MPKGTFSGRGTLDFRGTFMQKSTSGQAFYWADHWKCPTWLLFSIDRHLMVCYELS
jgi:hypothetical protein